MTDSEFDLLKVTAGSISAPAGCGKTQLISDALVRHEGLKPILVLTHTNAGVVALRSRLDKAGVKSNKYKLSTLDGWAMRLISTFPLRSGHDPSILNLENPSTDYTAIKNAAAVLLSNNHVKDVIFASYAQVIVDEYQDCTGIQHSIVTWLAQVLPTCVLGDPLQSIFTFTPDQVPDWNREVCRYFPPAHTLAVPWRWKNDNNEELGVWILFIRNELIAGNKIDLQQSPDCVEWVELDGTVNDHQKQLTACQINAVNEGGRVLIVGESTNPLSQQNFAKATPGATTVESVDLKDLVRFAEKFDLASTSALSSVLQFSQTVMANVGAQNIIGRVKILLDGTERKEANDVEKASIQFHNDRTLQNARDLLVEINRSVGVRIFRPAVLRACLQAMNLCITDNELSFVDAAIKMREQNRLLGRPLPKKGVGSTLLLKGLEADTVVILDASNMNRENLYVALSRGSKKIIICSRYPTLPR